ncbi:MAG: hypothetical protein QM761_14715 [Pseudoxanthomonas sp.]
MKPQRRAARHDPPRPPVVVSFDRDGVLLDVVGDLDGFVAEGDARDAVCRRLHDLRGGGEGAPRRVPAVELSDGRYADVDVVEEDEGCHFVLHDATAPMQALRRSQQAGHELELKEAAQRRALRNAAGAPRADARELSPFRRGAETFAALVEEMRASLALLAGHARLLEQRHRDDPASLRSIAAVQHAAVRLEAAASNGLAGLVGDAPAKAAPGVLELPQLAGLLQRTFALQAHARGLGFQVRLPRRDTVVEIDDLALRQLLINLLIHALDGIDAGEVVLSLGASGEGLEIEIACEPDGFDAALFGPLVVTDELLRSHAGASLGLAVAQSLLRRMRAEVELVPRRDGGHELWMRLPLARAAAAPGELRLAEGEGGDG